MRISFLVPHLARISGGVRIICEYARRLAPKGHQVVLICKERKSPIIRNIVHSFVNTIRWIDLKNVKIKFVPEFETENIPDGDVIFATSWKTAFIVNKLPSGKGRKFYLIQHLESILNELDKSEAEKTYYLPLTKIAVSRWLQEELEKLFGQKAEWIPDAIEHEEFFPENKIYGTKRIGLLYHTAEWKGFSDGLKAIEIARKTQPDIKLVIFGIRKKRFDTDINIEIKYYHSPSARKLRTIYNSCDVFVCPSWYEGFGLPGLEAMACRSALVTTDNGGCRDYAIHNETALVSPSKNPSALAENVIKLLSDKILLTKISEQGYEMSKKFNWQHSVHKMERLIQ
jgi:glycosyltransferase involved in cell wall biosynthesis